jgi:rare lipoprotein A
LQNPALGKRVTVHTWFGKIPQRAATGAAFDPNGLTPAHDCLPFGTRVRVSDRQRRRRDDQRSRTVRTRPRARSIGRRRALGIQGKGVSRVHGEVL